MSVVSELRALALELDQRAGDINALQLKPKMVEEMRGMSTGLRTAAMEARLRALRAETSVECRTDERPRFAQLRAPQRPSGPCSCSNRGLDDFSSHGGKPTPHEDHCPRRPQAPYVFPAELRIPSEFEAPRPPVIQPPAELMTHRVLDEHGTADELIAAYEAAKQVSTLWAGHPSGRGHGPGGRLVPMDDDTIEITGLKGYSGWNSMRFKDVGHSFWGQLQSNLRGAELWRWPHKKDLVNANGAMGVTGPCCPTCDTGKSDGSC